MIIYIINNFFLFTFKIVLFDSVAPDVKIISFSSAPIRSATYLRAIYIALSDSHPYS